MIDALIETQLNSQKLTWEEEANIICDQNISLRKDDTVRVRHKDLELHNFLNGGNCH